MGSALSRLTKFIGRFGSVRRHEANASVEDLSPAPPTEASVIAGHQLLQFIGKGAYGEVWLARDEIGVYHAVKIIQRSTFPDKSPFEREYRGILHYTPLSRTHQSLVHILNVGRDRDAGFFYYVMELADCARHGRQIVPASYCARTLAHEMDTRGCLPVRECIQIGIDLAEGLRYLHGKQLIHRDIKPANIIFVNGIPKLADVGLVTHVAEARRDPKHLGTEGFIPPEGPGTTPADIYSLGRVLREASFGRADGNGGTPAPPLEELVPDDLSQFR